MVVEPQHRLVTLLPPLTDTACAACIAFAATTVACMPNRHCLYVLSYGYIMQQKYANMGFMGKKWSEVGDTHWYKSACAAKKCFFISKILIGLKVLRWYCVGRFLLKTNGGYYTEVLHCNSI